MTDENNALDVLHDSSENAALKAQVAELQERLAKHETGAEIAHPQFNGEVPRYRLNSACYLEDDTLHVEGEEIEYLNTPNTEMVPLNQAARDRMMAYLEQLQEGQQAVSKQNGRQTGPLILDKAELIAAMSQDARREPTRIQAVRMPEEKGMVYPMPNIPESQAQQRKRGGPRKGAAVVSSKPPAPPSKVKTAPDRVLGGDMLNTNSGNTRG